MYPAVIDLTQSLPLVTSIAKSHLCAMYKQDDTQELQEHKLVEKLRYFINFFSKHFLKA